MCVKGINTNSVCDSHISTLYVTQACKHTMCVTDMHVNSVCDRHNADGAM